MLCATTGAVRLPAVAGQARASGRAVVNSGRVAGVRSPLFVRDRRHCQTSHNVVARAEKDETKVAAPAEDDEDLPPWVRREREKKIAEQTGDLPFGLYLLFSSLVAIAAIGSIFEFANKNPLFGVVTPDSPLWAPILLTFAITGLPSAGYLFVKAITAANKAADAMDKVDGY